MRVGFKPTAWMCRLDSGNSEAAAIKNTAEERSPGNLEFAAGEFSFAVRRDADGAAVAFEGNAKFFKSEFGVIAGAGRFGDAGFAFGKKSGEQNRGFYLRAGHGHFVLNAAQFAAANFERGKIFVARADLRAHFAQRSEDALHGAFVERVVAGNFAGEILPGKNAGEQANGGAGISGVEGAPTAFQSAQAVAGDANEIFFNFDFGAQGFHAAEGAVAVGGQREIGQFAGAFGDAREHGVAVGDGFVAWGDYAAGDDFGWMNCFFAQGCSLESFSRCSIKELIYESKILACGARSFLMATVPEDSLMRCTACPSMRNIYGD